MKPSRITYVPLLLAFVLCGTVAYLAVDLKRSGQQQAVERFNRYQGLLAQQLAGDTARRFETVAEVVLHLAHLAAEQGSDATQLHAVFQAFLAPGQGLPTMSIIAADRQGGVIYATRAIHADLRLSEPGLMAWAKQPENRGRVRVFILPIKNLSGADPHPAGRVFVATPLWLASPAVRPPGWSGVLLVSADIEPFLTERQSETDPEGRPLGFWVLDQDGTVLLQTEHPEMTLGNLRRRDASCFRCHVSFDYVERMLSARRGTAEYRLVGQPAKVAAYASMTFANASWIFVVNAPQADVVAFLDRSLRSITLLLGLLVAAFSLGSWSVYRSLVSSVQAREEARQWQEKHRLLAEMERTREQTAAHVAALHRRNSLILDSVMDGIIGLDGDGRQTFANAAAVRMLGWQAEELVGQPSHAMWHHTKADGSASDEATCPIHAVYRDGRIHRASEDVFWRKDGTPFSAEYSSTPIRDGNQVVGAVVSFRDISEKRRLEAQLRQAQKMEAIGTLAGGIAHDFNNILAIIMGHAEQAQLDLGKDQAVREALDEVIKAARRAADLVRQILSFSRNREQDHRSISVAPIARDALRLLRSTLPAAVSIDADIADDAPRVRADATQLYQVFVNLAANAAHAMREQGGRLFVRVAPARVDEETAAQHPDLRPRDYVRITVGDNGRGMDAETLERVFEPFFTTKAQGEGTGLGLAVVHGIVRGLDGVILVRSEPGLGTTFDIYLPVDESRPMDTSPATTAVPRGDGQRILLVDDEPALGRASRRLLESLGYRVETHTSPAAAIEMFEAGPDAFDLVITDLAMPGMSGLDLIRQILARRPGQRMILTSGFSGALSPGRARELGVRAILHKPLDAVSFGQAVHAVLQADGDPDAGGA